MKGEYVLYNLTAQTELIATLYEEIERLQHMRYYKPVCYAADRVISSNRYGAAFEDCQDEIDILVNRLHRMIARYSLMYERCVSAIDDLSDPREQKYLMSKYMQGKTEQELMSILGVSRATLYRIHDSAMVHFNAIYKDGET